MAERNLPEGQVPYEHNGYEQIFTQQRTLTNFYFNNPEMSNVSGFTGVHPTNYDAVPFTFFSQEAIVKFSGLSLDIEGKSQEEIDALAKEITEKYKWEPQLNFELDAPDNVKERYATQVARYVANKALKGNVFVPEEWVEALGSNEDLITKPHEFSNEEIAGRLKVLRRGIKRFEILGNQVQLTSQSKRG